MRRGEREDKGHGVAVPDSRVNSPGDGSVLVPLLALVPLLEVSDAPSTVEKEAVEAANGAETVPALQLRRPGP